MNLDEIQILHLWRAASREADLTQILLWGMGHSMDLAISHAVGETEDTTLTAGAVFEGITDPEAIRDALLAEYANSGADAFWNEFVDTTIEGYLYQFTHDQVGDTLADYGVVPRVNFDLYDTETSRVITDASNRISGSPQSMWTDHIAPELVRGLEAGESIPDLADRVRLFVPETYRGRARTIARTEVISASNAAAEDLANRFKLGTKIWLATGDDRTRPDHVLMNRVAADEEGWFTLPDGSRGRYPSDPDLPAHQTVNCRCTPIWEQRRDDRRSEDQEALVAEVDEFLDRSEDESVALVEQYMIGRRPSIVIPVIESVFLARALVPERVRFVKPAPILNDIRDLVDGVRPGPRPLRFLNDEPLFGPDMVDLVRIDGVVLRVETRDGWSVVVDGEVIREGLSESEAIGLQIDLSDRG